MTNFKINNLNDLDIEMMLRLRDKIANCQEITFDLHEVYTGKWENSVGTKNIYSFDAMMAIVYKMEELTGDISEDESEADRFYKIYSRITHAITYDHERVNSSKIEDQHIIRNLYGGLLEGKTVCFGYSLILHEALKRVEIKSEMIDGLKRDGYETQREEARELNREYEECELKLKRLKNKIKEIKTRYSKKHFGLDGIAFDTEYNELLTENDELIQRRNVIGTRIMNLSSQIPAAIGHAWNQVMIDGKWYNVDATWDAAEIQRKHRRWGGQQLNRFEDYPPEDYIYMLLDDENFSRGHLGIIANRHADYYIVGTRHKCSHRFDYSKIKSSKRNTREEAQNAK